MEAKDHARAAKAELFDAAPMGIVEVKGDGTVVRANRAAEPLLDERGRAMLRHRPTSLSRDGRHYRLDWNEVDGRWLVGATDVTNERERSERAEARALTDELTGLGNRARFDQDLMQRLSSAERNDGTCALLLIDLDRFKNINDTLGHDIGDQLLAKAADRIRHCLRAHDVALRLGGDEFAVVMETTQEDHATASRKAEGVATRLIELMSRLFVIDGHTIAIGCSIGIALGSRAKEQVELVKQADIALYRAKEARGSHAFFEKGMDTLMRERRELEQDLAKAVALEQFELHYQPLFDFEANRIEGWEALLRWRRPGHGLVGPSSFIELAEETTLMVPIGEWVMRTACRAATRWPDHMTVSVNVSPVQFASGNLVAMIEAALAKTGLQPHRLEVEITESMLMEDGDQTIAVLDQLRALGIRVALDDFGTGYSSLSRLQQFPFDVIKIDQSFVRGGDNPVKNTAIVRAVAAMCSHLGMKTTAEGVETLEQLQSVRADGCNKAQGFLLSRPVPESEIQAVIERVSREHVPRPTSGLQMPAELSTEAETVPIYRLTYRSRCAIRDIEADVRSEFEQILTVSQLNNVRRGITGALMFNGQAFVQILEGPQEEVEKLFETIQLDPRHADVTVLDVSTVSTRRFGNWSMAHIAAHDAMDDFASRTGFEASRIDADAVTRKMHALLLAEEDA